VPRHRSGANATISSERTPAARSCRRIAQPPAGRTDRFARNPLKQPEEVAAVILDALVSNLCWTAEIMRLLEAARRQVLWAPAGYCTTTLAPDEDQRYD